MSTSSHGDRPRRPFPQKPQGDDASASERRQQPSSSHRRDDLRHVEEELARAESKADLSDDLNSDELNSDELSESLVKPDADEPEIDSDLLLEDDMIEADPPVASRALPPAAQPRAGKRFDPPTSSLLRETPEKPARRAEDKVRVGEDKSRREKESRESRRSAGSSSASSSSSRPKLTAWQGDEDIPRADEPDWASDDSGAAATDLAMPPKRAAAKWNKEKAGKDRGDAAGVRVAPSTTSDDDGPTRSVGEVFRNLNRRKLARYGIIASVLVTTVWLAPIIAGYTPLRNLVLSSLGQELNGKVTASSASFGWFSPVQLHNLEVRDDRGELVLTVPVVKTSRMLRQIIFDASNVGAIELERPQVRVVFDKTTSNVERVLSKILNSRDSSLKCPKLDVVVVDGSVAIEDPASRGRWQIDALGAKLALPRDWSGPMDLQVAGKIAQTYRGGQFDAHLEMTKARQADGYVDSAGTLKFSVAQFPLAMTQSLLSRYEPETLIAGALSGEGTYQWDQETRDGRPVTVDANLTGQGIELRAPSLGTDTLRLDQLQVPCHVIWQGEQIRIDRFGAACDFGQVSLNGGLVVNIRQGLARGLNQALRANTYEFKGTVDLARLAKILPDTLAIRQGTQITSGALQVELSRVHETSDRYGAGPVWKGQLVSTSLRAMNEGRQVTWDRPIEIRFAAQESPQGLNIQSLECRSDFIRMTAKGEPKQLTITANYNLDQLATRLSDFLDLSDVKLAGNGESQLKWNRYEDGRIDLTCDSQLDRFAIRLGKRQLLAEDKLGLQLKAALQADPQTRRLQRVEAGKLIVTSGSDRLEAVLATPVDLAFVGAATAGFAPTNFAPPVGGHFGATTPTSANLPSSPTFWPTTSAAADGIPTAPPMPQRTSRSSARSRDGSREAVGDTFRGPGDEAPGLAKTPIVPLGNETVWPLDVDLRGDLARWRTRLQPYVNLPADWRVVGDAHLSGHVDWSRSQIVVHNSEGSITGFRAVSETWVIDEPEIKLSFTGKWRPVEGHGEVVQAVVQSRAVAFDAHQLSWTCPRRGNAFPTLHGEVTYNVDLDLMQRWTMGGSATKAVPAYRVTGVAVGKAEFTREGQSATGKINALVDNFSIRASDAREPWRDPRAKLLVDVRYDQLSDILHINKLEATTTSNVLSFRSSGKIIEVSKRRQLDLSGDLAYSAQEVAGILFPAGVAAKDIQISAGRRGQPFYVKGVLGDLKAGDPFALDPRQAALPTWARLTAGSQVDWTGANVYGFRFGAGEIQAEFQNGQIYFRPFSLAMNDGRLIAAPRIDFVSNPARVILEAPDGTGGQGKPFTLVDHVRITPEMCNRGLKYALPAVYGVAEAQGQFSVRLKGCEIPLDDPYRGERAGEITVHDVQLAPGPMLSAVAQAIDVVRLAGGKAPTTPQQRTARLKRESVVEYRMVDGKVYHRNLELEFDGLTIKTNGWVALVGHAINIEARVSSPKLTPRVPLVGANPTEFPIFLVGTLEKPQIDRTRSADALKAFAGDALLGPTSDAIRRNIETGTRGVVRGIDNGLDRLINPRRP